MKTVSFLFAAFAGFLLLSTPAQAQVAELSERRLMQPTGWYWLTGVTSDQVSQRVAQGYRIFDLEIESVSPLRFSTAMVKNDSPHKKTWWWFYGLTAQQVSQKIDQHNARLIDLEVYFVGSEARYALVLVSNTGDQQKAWWYYSKLSFEQLQAKLEEKNGRLLDLDTYVIGADRFFSAVMVPNTGSEAKNWWYYTNLTAAELKTKLDQHNARITDIEVRSTAGNNITFTVLMEKLAGETWWYYYGKTMNQVNDLADQHGARIIDVEPYEDGGQKRLAVVLLRNTNDLTNDMRKHLAANSEGGAYGLYLKKVDGNVLASLQEDKAFYPASTIKVLEHVHAMRAVQAGTVSLATNLKKYENGAESCADNHAGHTVTNVSLENILKTMMQNSDNQSTNAVQEYFGNGNAATGRQKINQTASGTLGLSSKTKINHKFGCGGPTNNPANSMTLADLGKLYEKVTTGTLNAANEAKFDQLMDNMSKLTEVINEEANSLGISAANLQIFKNNLESRAKAGSFTSGGKKYLSVGGWVSLPVKSGSPKEYVFGLYIDKADSIQEGFSIWEAGAKMLRESIRQALATYQNN